MMSSRKAHLVSGGKHAKHGRVRASSADCWRCIRVDLEEASGVDFMTKDFRSTLTTLTVRDDLSRLPAMSIQLRHASVGTTQKFYADIKRAQAGKQLKNFWKDSQINSVKEGVY